MHLNIQRALVSLSPSTSLSLSLFHFLSLSNPLSIPISVSRVADENIAETDRNRDGRGKRRANTGPLVSVTVFRKSGTSLGSP